MRRLLAAVAVLTATVALTAQTGSSPPPRDIASSRSESASPKAAGRLSGRVVSVDTGDSLRNARVTISPAAADVPLALTDGDGRFTFGSLPAGSYTVFAAKAGYAPAASRNGARGPVVVKIGDGADVTGVVVPLARGAAITGRMTDDLGEPIANTTVFVEQLVESKGVRSTRERRSVQTNDAGEYRVGSLSEGDYVVSRQAPVGMQIALVNGNPVIFQTPGSGRPIDGAPPRVFFPNAATLAGAEVLSLKAGEERPSVDLIGSRPDASIADRVVAMNPARIPLEPGARTTSSIRGRVLGATGPLVEAEVRLTGDTIRSLPPVYTDALGQYEFANLPPGVYSVTARKSRYITREFGQGGTADRGTRFTLGEDEQRDRTDITLPRTSAIAGQLADEYGDPVEGAAVLIHQIRFIAGRRRLVDVSGGSTARTDDQGRYRLFGLQPGSYVVAAYVGQLVLGQQGLADIPGYATTYFPGTPNVGEMRLVSVPVSQDLEGIDFSLSRIATATISGVARTSTGEPIAGGLVLGSSRRSGAVGTMSVGARINPDGSFAFPNVPPGQYVIQVYRGRLKPSVEGEFAAVPVTVNGVDITDLLVQTSPGSTVSGRVTFDGAQPPAGRAIDITAVPSDVDAAPFDGHYAQADLRNDWTFEMSGLSGPRRLRVLRTPRGWGLERILVNGVDVTDTPLPFGARSQSLADVEVVLTDRVTEISGTVTDDHGKPVPDARVVVFAADPDLWYERSRFVKITASNQEGAFTVRDLPPGSYFASAVDRRQASEENGEWLNPELLDSLTSGASRFTLAEGQKLSVSPRLVTR